MPTVSSKFASKLRKNSLLADTLYADKINEEKERRRSLTSNCNLAPGRLDMSKFIIYEGKNPKKTYCWVVDIISNGSEDNSSESSASCLKFKAANLSITDVCAEFLAGDSHISAVSTFVDEDIAKKSSIGYENTSSSSNTHLQSAPFSTCTQETSSEILYKPKDLDSTYNVENVSQMFDESCSTDKINVEAQPIKIAPKSKNEELTSPHDDILNSSSTASMSFSSLKYKKLEAAQYYLDAFDILDHCFINPFHKTVMTWKKGNSSTVIIVTNTAAIIVLSAAIFITYSAWQSM